MFGISLGEFVVIALLCVAFVRPADMPKVARVLARLWLYVERLCARVRAKLDSVADPDSEIEPMFDSFQKQLDKMKRRMSEKERLDLYAEIRNKKTPRLE
jgi:Sec-independent protein translocase protein TatA